MTAAPIEPPIPQTELELIRMKMNAATDDSLESTRRMLTLSEEAKEAGISTLVMLDDQGEQMDRIEEGMDHINQDMKDAEKHLEDLNKCCGLCILPWNKRKKSDDKKFKGEEDGRLGGDGPRVVVDQNGAVVTSGYITRITNDAREDEMDQNITEVGGMLGNLRNMAVDMGNEISNQNRQLDRINYQAWLAGIADKAESFLVSLDQSSAGARSEGRGGSQQKSARSTLPVLESNDVSTGIYANKSSDQSIAFGTAPTFNDTVDGQHGVTVFGRDSFHNKNGQSDELLLDYLNGITSLNDIERHSSMETCTTPKKNDSSTVIGTQSNVALMSHSELEEEIVGDDHGMETKPKKSPLIVPTETDASKLSENQLLKRELVSLNGEIGSLHSRIYRIENEKNSLEETGQRHSNDLLTVEKRLRELQEEKSNLMEYNQVQQTQFTALQLQHSADIADRELRIKQVASKQDGYQSALQDCHTQLQEQRQKVNDLEELNHRLTTDLQCCMKSLEHHKTNEEETVRMAEWQKCEMRRELQSMRAQWESAQEQYLALQKELTDYKEKATAVLHIKERTIQQFQQKTDIIDGNQQIADNSLSSNVTDTSRLLPFQPSSLLLSLQQERDLLSEEVQRLRQRLEQNAGQNRILEKELHRESENWNHKMRSDCEDELERVKHELCYQQDRSIRHREEFQGQLDEKRCEIERFRDLLQEKASPTVNSPSTENHASSSHDVAHQELQGKVLSLTETVIHKQTQLEVAYSENLSLQERLNRTEGDLFELERLHVDLTDRARLLEQECGEQNYLWSRNGPAGRGSNSILLQNSTTASAAVHHYQPTQPPVAGSSASLDCRNRGPLRIGLYDQALTRGVKRAVNVMDFVGRRVVAVLRSHPRLRLGVLCYIVVLHLWVTFVLLTYQPELHDAPNG